MNRNVREAIFVRPGRATGKQERRVSSQSEPMGGRTLRGFLADFLEPEARAWRGDMPLWKVFWGYGVLASSLLIWFYALAVFEDRPVWREAIMLVFAFYTVWLLVSIWRCAANARPFWGILARWLVVAWAGNTAMLVPFLHLDLLLN